MKEISFYSDSVTLSRDLRQLRLTRRSNKVIKKRQALTSLERKQILEKTDHRCHVCGSELTSKFQADHVKCLSSGGDHNVANYLPSCNLCNNYRWHYSPEEIQWILKLGVWIRGQIENKTEIGKLSASNFIKHEKHREKRRINPRS